MKHFLLVLLAFFSLSSAFSQINPVKWSTEVEKISETEYNLIFKADIQEHWHLYSQHLPEGGALPTEFEFDSIAQTKDYKRVGKVLESKSITKFDKVFEMDLTYFDGAATFTQKVELLNPDVTTISSEVYFQACDDEKCIFESEILNFELSNDSNNKTSNIIDPIKWNTNIAQIENNLYEIVYEATIDKDWHFYSQQSADDSGLGPIATEFSFNNESQDYELVGDLEESKTKEVFEQAFLMKVRYFENKAVFKQKFKVINPTLKTINAEVFYQACDAEKCLAPTTFTFNTNLDGSSNTKAVSTVDARSKEQSDKLQLNVTGWEKYEKEEVKEKSNFGIFVLGFLGGLIALLTPCVFPMIPLTVSFFTKSASNSQKGLFNAMLYGLFILVIYVLLSVPFHFLDSLNPEILNTISTNVWLNIIFFIILAFFAFSFFGYYEITLPASWGNKMDSASNVGGIIGVFFMALTLAIVSFSCTGPILGSLLAGSLTSDGGAMQLTMGMSGFGLALALPFTLFAMFPKWLNALPKSGGWLNTVKVVLGFAELAMAFKFLSNADLVKHWGLLKREVFIGIWIILGIGLLLYLLGKIKFPHDSPLKKLSFGRISFAVLVGAFVVYLIPGTFKTPTWSLNAISGFPPPMFYSIYERSSECPLGLNCYKDLEEGVEAAKAQNKPIMLDFTGWACVNCRKMEEQVWSKTKIFNVLQDEYVIISLYVDDRKELEKEDQFQFLKHNGSIKNIKTIGDKWATLQTLNFQNNSQPFYVLLNHDMELLNTTNEYDTNGDAYYNWLVKGVENFKK